MLKLVMAPLGLLAFCVVVHGGHAPALAQASMDLKCGKTTYTVSTGTKAGECKASGPEGKSNNIADCQDGKNSAWATCSGGCEGSSGAGKCSVKSAGMTADPGTGPTPPKDPKTGVVGTTGGGLLDPGQGTTGQGPAQTGTPVAPAAPPPVQLR